jgi:hypothetical protein
MFIGYIAFGIASGLIAAIVALFSGAGFLTAFFAYILAGIIGVVAGSVWAIAPKYSKSAKQPLTHRS